MYLTKETMQDMTKDGLIEDFDESGIGSICYDLRVKCYIVHGREVESIQLKPMESVIVRSRETIHLPDDMLALVHLRNSRIRLGLTLDAPVYQPGHITSVYFRVTNLSDKLIALTKDDELASVMFYQLDTNVDPYSGAFQNEFDYKGLASYETSLSKELEEVKESADSVKGMEKEIYSNVLQIMAIFVGIFSLLNVNLSSVIANTNTKTILIINLATIGSVGFMTSLIGKNKKVAGWVVSAIAFLIAIFIQVRM